MNKNLGILATNGLLSILFWSLIHRWVFSSAKFQDLEALIGLVVIFCIFIAVAGLGLVFLRTYPLKIALIFSTGVPIFFFFPFDPLLLLAITALFWVQIYAAKVISDELAERNKVNIRVILMRGLPPIITSILIMISFAYFLTPQVQAIIEEQSLPTTFQSTIREVMVTVFRGDFENLPPAEQEQVPEEVFNQLNDLIRPVIRLIPPILAFGLFLLLQSIAFIFLWIAVLFGVLIFKLLKTIEFFTIKESQVKAEVIEI